jgi:hypothetical protein
MTPARRKKKRASAPLAAIAVVTALLGAASAAWAGLSERIVVDWHSGLAIGGYDPVAFFTDGKPVAGSADLELPYDGAVWRFRNSGNRAAFAERPDVYMPQFGGYDPVGVTRGLAVAGNPDIWAIVGERLYLFYDVAQREKFLADPARMIATAQRRWPDVMRGLDP